MHAHLRLVFPRSLPRGRQPRAAPEAQPLRPTRAADTSVALELCRAAGRRGFFGESFPGAGDAEPRPVAWGAHPLHPESRGLVCTFLPLGGRPSA